jgi:hypothetical protein
MKRKKPKEITDEMIGDADKICACSAIVGDIINATNAAEKKKASLKELLHDIENKTEKGS